MIVDQNGVPNRPQQGDGSDKPLPEPERSEEPESDLPPVYSPPTAQTNAESSSSMSNGTHSERPNIKASNFIRVVQPNSNIKGTWMVDPLLRIPTKFLPQLQPGETEEGRKNLSLESRNGYLEVEIYVVPTQSIDQKPSKRITLHSASLNGSVTTKVYDVPPTEIAKTRLPMYITTGSRNGRVNVFLPRSFHGLVNVELHNGNVRYSDAMQALLTPLSDVNGIHRSFLGHLDASEIGDDEDWAGDELEIKAHNGNVRLFFNDETPPPITGFWAKLFSG